MKTKLALIFMLCFFISCEKEDECKDCTEALAHLAQKIKGQGCNPNRMDDAVARVRANCLTRANAHIGYIAERCNIGMSAGHASCENPNMSLNGIRFRILSSYGLPDSVFVIIEFNEGYNSTSFPYKDTQVLYHTNDYVMAESSWVNVKVLHPISDVILVEEDRLFTFARPGYWLNLRTIDIHFRDEFGYLIKFENW